MPVADLHVDAAARADTARALTADAGAIAGACADMAERFRAGGRLLVLAVGSSASDAHHVAVEFLHPVIVGKRALPALAIDGDDLAGDVALRGRPGDIALAISCTPVTGAERAALAAARAAGMLTVALVGAADSVETTGAHHCIAVPSADPAVVQEAQVTLYHVLWELVHVLLDARA
jgi:D-sedoheptulose 7-phosphate isomerase